MANKGPKEIMLEIIVEELIKAFPPRHNQCPNSCPHKKAEARNYVLCGRAIMNGFATVSKGGDNAQDRGAIQKKSI